MSSHSLTIVHVHVHVKPEFVDAFLSVTIDNARESLNEPGIARFDVVQQVDDRTRFVLVEVYKAAAAPAAHKETSHYARWRDAVAPMMMEPRTSLKYVNSFPDNAGF
jgi:autoinducer 2-degrading protein